MVAANDGGGCVSINGGKTWTDEDFPTAQLYHITVTTDFPYHVAGAQQDNSTVAVASEGWTNYVAKENSLKKNEWAYEVGGGESGYITQDPRRPNIFYAGSQGALLTRYDRSTGQTRDVQVYPRFFSGEPASALPERWQWTYPIVFSPKDPNRLYVCSQHVWVSTNEGQSWAKISPDLTVADTATLGKSGGVITMDMNGPEIYATVFALAPSYHDVNTIWAGSDDGLIHITRDHGKSWQNITPPDMPKQTRVSLIEASRHKPGTAYVAAKRYQMDDRSPYLYKTNDYGKTWRKIITGLRSDDYAHTIREDLTRPGLLYAGMEHGVWVSFTDGETWQSLQLKLPDTPIADLQVTEKDVVLGTHGRSIYVLDDIAPVREFTSDLAKERVHLFKPYYAVRRVQPAVFQYYLAKQTDSVKIEILDTFGALIQSFTGTKPTYPTVKEEDEDGGKPMVKLPTTATGLNRYEWDLRYPGATYFKGLIMWGARPTSGPLALPGHYQVRLTVGGQSTTHPFEIRLDPRLKGVTREDVQEQFNLAMKLRDQTSKANDAVVQIRLLKDKLARQPDTLITKKLNEHLSMIEENLYQTRNQSSQDPLNFPIKLNNRLAALWRSVESGDAKPTDGSYKVYRELSAELASQLAALSTLLQTDAVKALGL